VVEIFDSLQGEGYWTGVPITFVRLAGCNASELGLDCLRWCDTPGSWDPGAGETLSAAAIVARVHLPRLCLTGGEPLLQPEGVAELVAEAHRCGIRVHLETNGTVAPPAAERFDWIAISPKPPGYFIAAEWEGIIDELKLVAGEALDTATAERVAAAHPEAIVSVQPLWEGAPGGSSETGAVRLVMEHPDWRLSLQTHKYLGIR